MGFIPKQTTAMGEYRVEVRRESFYLHGSGGGEHEIIIYPDVRDSDYGTVEILTADIPKIRACLDVVEAAIQGRAK